MNRWITQLRKGMLEYIILNVLDRKESYGYEIIQTINTFEGMEVTESTVYPILARLKKDGYAKVRKSASQGGPPRRYYSVTTIGKSRLELMHQYWDLLNESVKRIREKEL